LEQLLKITLERLRVPTKEKTLIESELKDTRTQIASVWNDYFTDAISANQIITVSPGDYEKLISLSNINYPDLEDTLKSTVEKEVIKAIRNGSGYEALRSNLLKADLGDSQAKTLANTSISQFDNSYHVENALQAGIEEFIYDGSLKENTRQFCKDHLHKSYTLEQLRQMDNHQGLPVLYSLGGFNCTHFLTALITNLLRKRNH
jgi:hypothetical protein